MSRPLAVLAILLAAAFARPAAAQIVNPLPNAYQFSFLACSFVANCPNPVEFARFTWFGSAPLTATPLGPNNYFDTFRSEPVEVLPIAFGGVGMFEHVYLTSYRNQYGSGSFFVFDRLAPANNEDYGSITMIDAYVAGPTKNPLVWEPGLYTGLIAAPCNYSIACVSTPGAVESVRILVTEEAISWPDINDRVGNKPDTGDVGLPGAMPPGTVEVPEPASGLLLAASLAALGLRRRRA